MSDLALLLQIKAERQAFKNRILGAIALHYDFVSIEDAEYSTSAPAGSLYEYLSKLIPYDNFTTFQNQVKHFLVEEGLAKPMVAFGRVFFKGLRAKDPSADQEQVKKILQQHYKDRHAYRERQRSHAYRNRKHFPEQVEGSGGGVSASQHQTGPALDTNQTEEE